YTNPLQLTRSQLQRVAYRFEDNKLIRVSWKMLDQDFTQEPESRELLDKVERVDIRYFDQNAQPQEQWPSGFGENDNTILPKAVEFKVTFEDLGEIRRLFSVTPGAPSKVIP
ncbi:MAG: type II secretion system minor pseudopilin GspJ, partial [Gammaproteobacteria bacterium]|nr:type II secretion system minor pseudopilin GspJ [Gammaproteobacteria bacterium]